MLFMAYHLSICGGHLSVNVIVVRRDCCSNSNIVLNLT